MFYPQQQLSLEELAILEEEAISCLKQLRELHCDAQKQQYPLMRELFIKLSLLYSCLSYAYLDRGDLDKSLCYGQESRNIECAADATA